MLSLFYLFFFVAFLICLFYLCSTVIMRPRITCTYWIPVIFPCFGRLLFIVYFIYGFMSVLVTNFFCEADNNKKTVHTLVYLYI